MKLLPSGLNRKTFALLCGALILSTPVVYLFAPEMLVWMGTLVVADVNAIPAEAIVVLGGGPPSRVREAATLFQMELADWVVLTTEEPPESYAEMRRLGIDLFLAWQNNRRVLLGLGVPEERILRIDTPASETVGELEGIRDFASDRGWRRLIIVTSNYHTRRTALVSRYVFDDSWEVAVAGSRYDTFRPNNWWQDVRHVRNFLIELQKLILYELYLRPQLWF